MDYIVKQAMAKWPNVPHCYGWLGLDARGNWYMRDDAAQAVGAKGSLLKHEKLIDFIQRNYAGDAAGQWYFQNGPQRVYVELEAAPWVWRINDAGQVHAHDGRLADYQRCVVDEHGWLYLETSIGFGLVHTQDVQLAANAIEAGAWTVHSAIRAQLPSSYGFVTSPQARLVNKA
jgi:hypothetical protein